MALPKHMGFSALHISLFSLAISFFSHELLLQYEFMYINSIMITLSNRLKFRMGQAIASKRYATKKFEIFKFA